LYFVQKKVVGVFVRFRAPLQRTALLMNGDVQAAASTSSWLATMPMVWRFHCGQSGIDVFRDLRLNLEKCRRPQF
jgi:hypothetical protein